MKKKPYSVLLGYNPSECEDGNIIETYYAHVMAADRNKAVRAAQREMWRANKWGTFHVGDAELRCQELLVIEGHNYGI